jgi:hypothetical protein
MAPINLLSMVAPSEIVRSLDEAVRVDLENARDWYFGLLQFSTAVVAVGCIFEIPEVIHEVLGIIPERLVRPAKLVALVGLMLVIGGIAGEWLFEAHVATAEGLVQKFDEILLTETQRETAIAQLETAQLQEDTQGLKTEADVAKLETARLNAQIAPRRLTVAQQKQISHSLKLFTGKIVGVATYQEDAEAMVLGLQIEETLRNSGITVWDRIGTFTATGMPVYMGVVIDSNHPEKDLASHLLKALSTEGKLVTTSAPVSFGQGSTMWVPPSPKGIKGATFVENAMIFIGEKPIAEKTQQSRPKSKP